MDQCAHEVVVLSYDRKFKKLDTLVDADVVHCDRDGTCEIIPM